MTVTNERVAIHTDNIVKEYLLNGDIPDELVVEERLYEELSAYYDAATDSYSIENPLWALTNLTYRETSDISKWNKTQYYAAEDMTVLYRDFINNAKTLTDKLALYMAAAQLIRVRVNKLLGRIENLMLLADSTEGFLYSFFDTFDDKSKTSYEEEHKTTSMVNIDAGQVELARKNDTGIADVGWADQIVNLQFLQNNPTEVSFAVLNPTLSISSLSSASLTDIFNNSATAWQREIITTSSEPMIAQLTVRVSPLDPIAINRIELQTKMSNYSNQLQIQVFYSQDGVSYLEIPSPSNPMFIQQSGALNFSTVYATHFRFLITKNIPDSGHTFVIGFQSINFIQTQYNNLVDGNVFYSVPITFPDTSRPIGKIACEVCESKPLGTDIKYYIVAAGNLGVENDIPITPTNSDDISYSKIIDLGSLGTSESIVTTADVSGVHQWTLASGVLSIPVTDLVTDISGVSPVSLSYGDTIAQTLEIYRCIGSGISFGYNHNMGFNVPPDGLGEDYFLSNVLVNNEGGVSMDFGATSLVVDGKKVSGIVSLPYGLHQVATQDLYQHAAEISEKSDKYFTWKAQYVSPFEFYNVYDETDMDVFTYNTQTGDVIMYPLASGSQPLEVDYEATFVPASGEGYLSSGGMFENVLKSHAIPSGYGITGSEVYLMVDGQGSPVSGVPHWVNQVDINITTWSSTTIAIETSIDGETYESAAEDLEIPVPGIKMFGTIRFSKPMFCRYVKVKIMGGSGVQVDSATFRLFGPLFNESGTLYTKPIYEPAGNKWDLIIDSSLVSPEQTYTIYSSFSDIDTSWLFAANSIVDISDVDIPKMYFKIVGSEPYVHSLAVTSLPQADERSAVRFSYHSTDNTQSHKSIRFKAVLSSESKDITPKLESYRVKLS